jgi:hypothetical protein
MDTVGLGKIPIICSFLSFLFAPVAHIEMTFGIHMYHKDI